jgi:hypothetical protein
MKTKTIIIILFALIFPINAFAINAPLVDEPPSTMDADFYTLTIYVEDGAKVSVVGGSADIAPVTDGAGSDIEDGVVEVMVGLAQNATNTFSITAERNGQTSASVIITINEVPDAGGGIDYPPAPAVNNIPEFVDTAEYIITGSTEPGYNIYVRKTDGTIVGTTGGNDSGYFQLIVPLEENKTNRFNISAENEAGHEGPATQVLIRQSADLLEAVVEEEPELITSSQIFFNDIGGHWAESYINTLYESDVVSGKSEGIFEPNSNITRAELTKIAIIAFGYSVNTTVQEHPFSDVPRNSWYAPYIEEAKVVGIVEGYPTGGFGPHDFITRAAALKIILGAADLNTEGSTPDFPDVLTDAWFAEYVGYAQDNDVVGGYPDGTFGPGRSITRAEVAKIVVKVLEMK